MIERIITNKNLMDNHKEKILLNPKIHKTVRGEIVGDIEAKSSNLKATTVPEKMAPRLIDE